MPRSPPLVCLLGLTMVTLTWEAALAQAVADSTAGPNAATDSPPRAKVKKRRDEVAQWLLRARFEPALDEDGSPTRGEFVFRVRAGS